MTKAITTKNAKVRIESERRSSLSFPGYLLTTMLGARVLVKPGFVLSGSFLRIK